MQFIDEALRPDEPQLLDTCVLQNIDWIDRQLEEKGNIVWDEDAVSALSFQYGSEHADDLIALGALYKTFEYLGGYPWLDCPRNLTEAKLALGARSIRYRDIMRFFRGHQVELFSNSYPAVTEGILDMQNPPSHPLILKSLGISEVVQLFDDKGPLSFLPNEGDRMVYGCAVLSKFPVIIATDHRTFWNHRDQLKELWPQLMGPSELIEPYETYWTALTCEFSRRRSE